MMVVTCPVVSRIQKYFTPRILHNTPPISTVSFGLEAFLTLGLHAHTYTDGRMEQIQINDDDDDYASATN